MKDNRYCLVFARIHFTGEVVDEDSENLEEDKKTFAQGFYDYYLGNKMPGREENYNDYLPILGSNRPSPRLILSSEVELQKEDIALVYVLNKYSPVLTKVISYIPFIWIGSKILTGESIDDLTKKLEKLNFIHMVPISDLDKLGCTEYLTIPA